MFLFQYTRLFILCFCLTWFLLLIFFLRCQVLVKLNLSFKAIFFSVFLSDVDPPRKTEGEKLYNAHAVSHLLLKFIRISRFLRVVFESESEYRINWTVQKVYLQSPLRLKSEDSVL